jgi:L-rhamnose mutarotase
MIRKAFVMSVNAGCETEYEKRHDPIWPELEQALLDHGVTSYSIFLHPETRQLFGYVEFTNEAQWRAIAQTEVCHRWWNHMSDVMPTNADLSPKSIELEEMFHMESDHHRRMKREKRNLYWKLGLFVSLSFVVVLLGYFYELNSVLALESPVTASEAGDLEKLKKMKQRGMSLKFCRDEQVWLDTFDSRRQRGAYQYCGVFVGVRR